MGGGEQFVMPRVRTHRVLTRIVVVLLVLAVVTLGVRGTPPASTRPQLTAGVAETAPVASPPVVPTTAPSVRSIAPGTTMNEPVARGRADMATHPAEHVSKLPRDEVAPHGPMSMAGSTPPEAHDAASHDGECQPTPEQAAAAQQLIESTRAAISQRFATDADAVAEGYKSDSAISGPMFRATHFSKWSEVKSPAVLDPNRPESLVYGDTERNGRVLLGALFIMPEPGMKGPEVGGCLTHWHAHGLQGYSREMLHVWIVDMPGGPFAEQPDPDYIRDL